MNTLYLISVVTLSTALGTFLANFALLWIIGMGIKKEQDRQMLILKEAEKEMVEKYNETVKRRKDYIAMES